MINETPTLTFMEMIFTHGFIKIILLVWTPLIVALIILAYAIYRDMKIRGI